MGMNKKIPTINAWSGDSFKTMGGFFQAANLRALSVTVRISSGVNGLGR